MPSDAMNAVGPSAQWTFPNSPTDLSGVHGPAGPPPIDARSA